MDYQFLYRVEGQQGRRVFYTDTLPHTCHGEPSIEEQIIDELEAEDRLYGDPGTPRTYTLAFCRPFTRSRSIGTTTLRLVEIDQYYGGPEEGGWYYDVEHLIREFTVPTRAAPRLRRRLERYADTQNEGLRSYQREGRTLVRTGPYVPQPRPHYC